MQPAMKMTQTGQSGTQWGTYIPLKHRPQFRVITDDPLLQPLLGRPPFTDYLARHLGEKPVGSSLAESGRAVAADQECAKHMCAFGASGSGKTTAMEGAA